MAEPRAAIEAVIAHRLRREAKVVAALEEIGPAPLEELLAKVYADVPERMHPVALRSLTAHLLKLREEGRGCRVGGWMGVLSEARNLSARRSLSAKRSLPSGSSTVAGAAIQGRDAARSQVGIGGTRRTQPRGLHEREATILAERTTLWLATIAE